MSKKAPLFSFKYLLHDFVKWVNAWKLLLWYRLHITYDGKESKKHIKGGAIVICNHVGFSDPFIIQCMIPYRRFRFLVAKEMFVKKFSAWWYTKVFLSYPIDREKPSYQTIKLCSNVARDGNLMCLFPEGHIKTDTEAGVDAFKGGAVLMAYMADVPIIPLYHEKRKSIWNMTRVAIGKPINVRELIGPVPNQAKINEVAQILCDYDTHLMEITRSKMKK